MSQYDKYTEIVPLPKEIDAVIDHLIRNRPFARPDTFFSTPGAAEGSWVRKAFVQAVPDRKVPSDDRCNCGLCVQLGQTGIESVTTFVERKLWDARRRGEVWFPWGDVFHFEEGSPRQRKAGGVWRDRSVSLAHERRTEEFKNLPVVYAQWPRWTMRDHFDWNPRCLTTEW